MIRLLRPALIVLALATIPAHAGAQHVAPYVKHSGGWVATAPTQDVTWTFTCGGRVVSDSPETIDALPDSSGFRVSQSFSANFVQTNCPGEADAGYITIEGLNDGGFYYVIDSNDSGHAAIAQLLPEGVLGNRQSGGVDWFADPNIHEVGADASGNDAMTWIRTIAPPNLVGLFSHIVPEEDCKGQAFTEAANCQLGHTSDWSLVLQDGDGNAVAPGGQLVRPASGDTTLTVWLVGAKHLIADDDLTNDDEDGDDVVDDDRVAPNLRFDNGTDLAEGPVADTVEPRSGNPLPATGTYPAGSVRMYSATLSADTTRCATDGPDRDTPQDARARIASQIMNTIPVFDRGEGPELLFQVVCPEATSSSRSADGVELAPGQPFQE